MSDIYQNATIIYIDSHNKKVGETHSNFSAIVNLPKDVDMVCVLRAAMKKCYYLVSSGANTFTLREDASSATITVPEGNYSASSFRIKSQALLNAASPKGWTYTVSLPNTAVEAATGKYTFTCVGGNPSFIFTDYLYEQFGFDINTTNTFASNTLTSTNIVNFQLKDVIRVHSNIVTNLTNNILQEVYASSTPDFVSIKYECNDILANSKPFTIKTNSFTFTVVDEEDRELNNNGNILLTLLFYKKNTLTDRSNQANLDWIKMQVLKK